MKITQLGWWIALPFLLLLAWLYAEDENKMIWELEDEN